jgi:predicted aminopeptidase
VDLHREAVVWNLFAAPELSLDPHLWCYPLVGCLPYRGYFDDTRVRREQARLAADGLDTYVGPVLAYSTLGWFDDPLLSTFLALDDMAFVELLLHELSHSRVWIRGDATFNESFASFVGRQGAHDFFASRGRLDEFEAWSRAESGWEAALGLLRETRDALRAVYAGTGDEDDRRAAKRAVLDAAGGCLTEMAVATGIDGYRQLIPRLNNAYLASLATYEDALPVFAGLFAAADEDWARFFARVDSLAALGADERAAVLAGSGEQHVAADADDDRADQVQCESLLRHGLDAEATRAEHDDIGSRGHG